MNKKAIIAITILFCATINIAAQGYISPPVTISSIRFLKDGVEYFSHPVTEKQTLYSICRAYQVSPQDIYDANKDLNIEVEGIKTGQALLIPNKLNAKKEQIQEKEKEKEKEKEDVTIYVVKWYEDLDAVAKRFNVSKESIMAANGLKSEKLSRRQKLIIPSGDILAAYDQSGREIEEDSIVQEQDETSGYIQEKGFRMYRQSESIRISLVLPFSSEGTIGAGSLDFYSGALLALKDLSDEGISTRVAAIDFSKGLSEDDLQELENSDVVLGPFSPGDITSILDTCKGVNLLVSPLDSRVSSILPDHSNLVQAPSSSEAQNQDVINWIIEDTTPEDKVILIEEKGAAPTLIDSLLKISGIPFETVSYGILEGRNIVNSLSDKMTKEAVNRVVIASDKEAFVNDAIRNLDLMVFSKFNIALYAPSRIRNYETIDVNYFHSTNLHVSSSYFINYDDKRIKKFLLEYRALFKSEPSQYSYQGYDVTKFFVNRFVQGDNSLTGTRSAGLQSDFKFEKTENGGYANTAIRRVEYSPENYSVKFVTKK